MQPDKLIRATAFEGRVRAFACLTTQLVSELQRRHATWPVATAALGRTASISAMVASTMKNNESITVKFDGDGPLGRIWVDAQPDGAVRGYVDEPHVHLPTNREGKLDVGGAVGQGQMYVIRDTGLKDYYTSSSDIQSGEIADDFTHYFASSEQTPSAVGAGVLVGTDNKPIVAGGFLVQLMPGHTESDIQQLEARLRQVPSVTNFLTDRASADALLLELLPEARIVATLDPKFRCQCSYHRLERILISLGREELVSLLEERGEAELICHFCSNVYKFSRDHLVRMISDLDSYASTHLDRYSS